MLRASISGNADPKSKEAAEINQDPGGKPDADGEERKLQADVVLKSGYEALSGRRS